MNIGGSRSRRLLTPPYDHGGCTRDASGAVLLVLFFLLVPLAFGQAIPGYPTNLRAYDPREVALLPPYCSYTQDFRERVPNANVTSEIERWHAVIGPTFQHLHHYCWGLMNLNRATILARDERTRRFYLSNAVREFDYVIERAPANFALLPEILTRKGEALIRLGQGSLAVSQLEQATQLKRDYWPAYAALSDFYRSQGEIERAKEALRTGLSFATTARALLRRLNEIESEGAAENGSDKR